MPTLTTPKPMPQPRNGIDTPALLTTINAVGAQPELAKFQFRAENRWQTGRTAAPASSRSAAPAGSRST